MKFHLDGECTCCSYPELKGVEFEDAGERVIIRLGRENILLKKKQTIHLARFLDTIVGNDREE